MAKSSYSTESDAEFLRSLAQNDYMIDTNYLYAGKRLNAIASRLEYYANRMSHAMEIMENEIEHWRKSQDQD